jgi:apolipoprotein N-acyltransferase
LLLYAAFPPLGWHDAAWVALVPLVAVAIHSRPWHAFRWGWLTGLFFWLPSLSWLLRLSVTGYPPVPLPLIALGWFLVAAYCALYVGAFAMITSAWCGRVGTGAGLRNALTCVLLAGIWAGLETWRGWLCGGFPWNALGVSQYQNLSVAQIAEVGGVGLVSGLVVMLNMSIAMTIARRVACYRTGERSAFHPELMIGLLACAVALVWGVKRLRVVSGFGINEGSVRISAVQPNIAQDEKWDSEFEALILRRLDEQTELAASFTAPDLIIWPETAIPWLFDAEENAEFMSGVLRHGVPVLLGAMTESHGPETNRYYNSAILCRPQGAPERYHKQKLVMFGEYIPFARLLPSFLGFDPLGWSCLSGAGPVIFDLEPRGQRGPAATETVQYAPSTVSISVLICFEDVFPQFARRAVRAGARLLIVQTNDAWFDPTHASVQHMAHSVLRCIENRVPMVRVGNTGVTCAIDPAGRISTIGPDGGMMLRRVASAPFIVPVQRHHSDTIYARLLYRIDWVFAALSLIGFGLAIRAARANNASHTPGVNDGRNQGPA